MSAELVLDQAAVDEWFGDHASKMPMMNLETALTCPIATEYFRLHCQKEFCEENLLALIEIRNSENISDRDALSEKAAEFLDRFLKDNAPLELNVPKKYAEELQELINNKKSAIQAEEVFLRVKEQISYNLRDPFMRFLDSEYLDECIPMCWYNRSVFSEKFTKRPDQVNKFLNKIMTWTLPPRDPLTVAASLLEMALNVIREHVKNNPTDFNYPQLIDSLPWKKFLQHTCELQKVDLGALKTVDERKAFFINVYNTMIIHGAVEKRGVPVVNLTRTAFMRKMKYEIAGLSFSLDCIEHGILRDNVKDWLLGYRFSKNDPRAKLVVPIDPRVHFCLATVSIESPRIEVAPALNAEKELDAFLNARTTEYLNRHVVVDTERKSISLPPVFSWYKADFGKGKADHLEFVVRHTRKLTEQQVELIRSGKVDPSYGKAYWVPSWDCTASSVATAETGTAAGTATETEVTTADGSSNTIVARVKDAPAPSAYEKSRNFSGLYLDAKAFMKREITKSVFKKKAKSFNSNK